MIDYYSHLCACGCGDRIEIKRRHKYDGIPKYIIGHNWRNKKRKPFTEEHRNKISEAIKGENHPMYGKKHTKETRQKQSEAKKGDKNYNFGKFMSKEQKQKIRDSEIGKIVSEEAKEKLRKYVGKLSSNWQGGKSFEIYPKEFKQIKKFILERDNYTCQDPNCVCVEESDLHVHHIDYNKKNNNPENLITLCNSCHAKTNGKRKRQYWRNYYAKFCKNNG